MKFYQQIRTSAPKGLNSSGQGFDTVACHPEIPLEVRKYTDVLGYEAEGTAAQPIYGFAIVTNWFVLYRACGTSADHTGRSNHIVHTLAASRSEVEDWLNGLANSDKPLVSPAALMLYWEAESIWRDSWSGEPRWFEAGDMIEAPDTELLINRPLDGWRDPAAALAALDESAKPKKLMWVGWDDSHRLLIHYEQVFRAMDPVFGVPNKRPAIEAMFPEQARVSWGHAFATQLMQSQTADDFIWFGTRNAQSVGAKSPREQFSPLEAAVPEFHVGRVEYVRNLRGEVLKRAEERVSECRLRLLSELEDAEQRLKEEVKREEDHFSAKKGEVDENRNAIDAWAKVIETLTNVEENGLDPLNDSRCWLEKAQACCIQGSPPTRLQVQDPSSFADYEAALIKFRELGGDDSAAYEVLQRREKLKNPHDFRQRLVELKQHFQEEQQSLREAVSVLQNLVTKFEAIRRRRASVQRGLAAVAPPPPRVSSQLAESGDFNDKGDRSTSTRKKGKRGNDHEPMTWILWALFATSALSLGLCVYLIYSNQVLLQELRPYRIQAKQRSGAGEGGGPEAGPSDVADSGNKNTRADNEENPPISPKMPPVPPKTNPVVPPKKAASPVQLAKGVQTAPGAKRKEGTPSSPEKDAPPQEPNPAGATGGQQKNAERGAKTK